MWGARWRLCACLEAYFQALERHIGARIGQLKSRLTPAEFQISPALSRSPPPIDSTRLRIAYTMYIAGLHVPITETQAIEGFTWSTAAIFVTGVARKMRALAAAAEHGTSAGPIKTMPKGLVARYVTPVHFVATVAPPLLYFVALPLAKFARPAWLEQFDLPGLDNGET